MHIGKASPETERLAEYLREKHDLKASSALIGVQTEQILLQQKEGFSYYSGYILAIVIDYIGNVMRVQLRRGSGLPVGGLHAAGYQSVNSIEELDIMIDMYADLLKKTKS